MSPEEREHIYILLGAMILADKRVRKVEVETFIALVRGFQSAFKDPAPMNRSEIAQWFKSHHRQISRMLTARDREAQLISHFTGLDNFAYKPQLLEAMNSIAVSDQELHDREFDLMLLAAAYWDIDPPRRV